MLTGVYSGVEHCNGLHVSNLHYSIHYLFIISLLTNTQNIQLIHSRFC